MSLDDEFDDWQPAKAGDVLVLLDDIDVLVEECCELLNSGEIVVCLGEVNAMNDMMFVTSKGIAGITNDRTFYLFESANIGHTK